MFWDKVASVYDFFENVYNGKVYKCAHLVATDMSKNMLKQTDKKTRDFGNVETRIVDLMHLDYADDSFNKVVAGNVIHLLDDPKAAVAELFRVCKPGGKVIIPTYINIYSGNLSVLARLLGKAGANFKRQFDLESYKEFFRKAGYNDIAFHVVEGRMPCAIAVIKK